MALSIPPHVADLLLRVEAFDDGTFESIASRLPSVKPVLYQEDFVARAKAEMPDVDAGAVDAVVNCALALASSADSSSRADATAEADEVVRNLPVRAGKDSSQLVARVARLLRCENVALVVKAYKILFESPRQLLGTRILSDIRPVFADDPTTPSAGMIVHELKIRYSGDRSRREFFVALDTRDMKELVRAIDRALVKDAALAEVLKASKLPQIDIAPSREPK